MKHKKQSAKYKKQIMKLLDKVADDDFACFCLMIALLNQHINSGSKWIDCHSATK